MKYIAIFIILFLYENTGISQSNDGNNGYLLFSPYSLDCVDKVVWLKFNRVIDEFEGENLFYESMKKVKVEDDLRKSDISIFDSLRVLSLAEKFSLFSIFIDPRNYLKNYSIGNNIYSFGEKDCFYGNHCAIIFNTDGEIIFYLLFSSTCSNAILVDLKRGIRQHFIYLNSFAMARINSLFFHINVEIPPIINGY